MSSENLETVENLETIYYTVEQRGRYYVINKMKVVEGDVEFPDVEFPDVEFPEGEMPQYDPNQTTIEGDTAVSIGDTVRPAGDIVSQYLYPVNHSYVQSIVKELIDIDTTKRVFGLLLINSLSRGTFVFSAEGLNNSEYIDVMSGMPFDYQSILDFFVIGGSFAVIDDGIKNPSDGTATLNP